MAQKPDYLFYGLLILLLSSCNIGGPKPSPLEREGIPEKTNEGADIIVCMVKNQFHVYREERGEMLFPSEEIYASPFHKYTATGGDTTVYLISGDRSAKDGEPETGVTLQVMAENPEVGVPYKLYSRDFAEYTIGNQSNQYWADTDRSVIKFSRIDKQVAAGDFVFIAVNMQNDTISVAGYFDVRFDH